MSALAGAWYEADSSAGLLRLYAARAVRHAADAAVLLARCEALLAALDGWTGQALSWRWLASPGAVMPTASHARVSWEPAPAAEGDARTQDRRDPGCRLELPWTLLRRLPAPPAPLAAQLHWADVHAVLAAAQWQIPDEELALLEPGGAVVLPASMTPDWRGLLRTLDERASPGAGVPVALAAPHAPQRIPVAGDAPAAVAMPAGPWCEVRIAMPQAIPGDRLAGWYDGEVLPPAAVDIAGAAATGPRASLWRCAADREPARCLATGALMPWADGWALAIEQCENPTTGR